MKMTSRQLQKERTKELLLKTAYEVFSIKGIMNTRISDITKAAGVSHGTMFVHFETQEDLVAEVVWEYGQKIALLTHELTDTCSSLRDVLTAHLDGLKEYESFYTRLLIENRLLPSAARDAWVSVQSAISFHFSRVAERELGELSDIPMLFNIWIGLVHHYLMNGDIFAPEGNVIERYGDVLIENYIKLIKGASKNPALHPRREAPLRNED